MAGLRARILFNKAQIIGSQMLPLKVINRITLKLNEGLSLPMNHRAITK